LHRSASAGHWKILGSQQSGHRGIGR
jgi:hypothetical protein